MDKLQYCPTSYTLCYIFENKNVKVVKSNIYNSVFLGAFRFIKISFLRALALVFPASSQCCAGNWQGVPQQSSATTKCT